MTKIYHNPRCGKSREAIQILEKENKNFEVVKYLENPPSKAEINQLLNLLKINPIKLVRIKEKIWVEQFKNKNLSDDDIIEAMVNYPILIERPIVVNGNKAVIGRPPNLIKDIL